MGEASRGATATGVLSPRLGAEEAAAPAPSQQTTPSWPVASADRHRRRFVWASIVGTAAVTVPYLWVLWSLWGPVNPIRKTVFEDNFYDLQARAMFHGHLYLANGAIGIEAFVHDGHQYTYFGLFPSIIRMPVLLVTSRLDGKLTAPSILLAWALTAVVVSMLLWRIRILFRGNAVVSWAEAVSVGGLMAATMGGSVLVYLAATPYVFADDLQWSVCLTVASFFALLGVIERPTGWRIAAAGVLILCANLNRATTGWACAVAAMLLAAWFGLGRAGSDRRRWWIPLFLAGLVPFLASVAVDMAKFGIPFGVPSTQQVYTKVNAYRRQFLAANHNSEVGTAFVTSDLVAYLQPFGLRIGNVFPYITLPARPAAALGGVLFDKRYRTNSIFPAMPLLSLLTCWGVVVTFLPKRPRWLVGTRFLVLAAGGAGVALMLWGYIAPRYIADFMPLLILGGGLGLVELWRRLDGRGRGLRRGFVAGVLVLTVYSVVANFGIAVTPNEEWTQVQTLNFVKTAQTLSRLTGDPLRGRVQTGSTLPAYAPAGQLFIVGHCDGLYISNGEDYSHDPVQQFIRYTWMPVQRGPAQQQSWAVRFRRPPAGGTESVVLATLGGRDRVVVNASAARALGMVRVTFALYGERKTVRGVATQVPAGTTHDVVVVADPAKHTVSASLDGQAFMAGYIVLPQPTRFAGAVSSSAPPGSLPALEARNTTPPGMPSLCSQLLPPGRVA